MRSITVFVAIGAFALIAGANAISDLKWDNLKITFGLSPFGKNFDPMPRTVDLTKGAKNGGWVNTNSGDCKNGGTYNGFRFLYNGEVSVGLLYDLNGVIAGIQMLLNKSEILSPGNKFHYDKVPMFQTETINSQQFFVLTTYFVQPDTICSNGRTATDLETQGTGTGLYFQNGPTPSTLIIPPKTRAEAIAQGWSKNNCFVLMGRHNFYKTEEFANTDCAEVRPVFLLFNTSDQLKAFGYVAFGDASSSRFEKPDATAIKAIVGDTTPKCLTDLATSIKVSSLHVYFINHPQLETCL